MTGGLVMSKAALTKQQVAYLSEIFRDFDKDCDGSITEVELGALIRSLGCKPDQKQLSALIQKADKNNNGLVEFSEFVALIGPNTIDKVAYDQEQLLSLFQKLDKDGNGYITAIEMASSMAKLGHSLSARELTDIIREADTDEDGRINFLEFASLSNLSRLFSLIDPNTISKDAYSQEQLLSLFQKFDKDGNGYITAVEMASSMANLGHSLSARELTDIIREADTDEDGRINFPEFASLSNLSQLFSLIDPNTVSKDTYNQEQLLSLFQKFDKDGNGYITAVEMASSMANLGHSLSMKELTEMIRGADIDGDGRISFPEFASLVKFSEIFTLIEPNTEEKTTYSQEHLLTLFQKFDRDGNGYITAVELASSMAKLGRALSVKELTEMIGGADTDGDGRISFSEFSSLAELSEFVDLIKPNTVEKVTYDQDQLLSLFRKFDRDGNGYITAVELASSMNKLGHALSAKELTEMIGGADIDGDGRISFSEFATIAELSQLFSLSESDTVEKVEYTQEQILALFQKFDRDGNGYITAVELAYAMAKLGHSLSVRDLSEMIAEADTDGDGKISFSEFVSAMSNVGYII